MEPAILASAQAMLRAVAAGIPYDDIAAAHGVTKSTVSVRVRRLAHALQQIVGVLDVDEDASPTATLLRVNRLAYLEALEHFHPGAAPTFDRAPATLAPAQIELLLQKIARHSQCPLRDKALLLALFSTGAKPLEIAQLAVRDYLDAAGQVRRVSVMRAEIAANGADRPLPFDCAETTSAIDAYLAERARAESVTEASGFRGLDPTAALFLSRDGRPLQVRRGTHGGVHAVCKEIHEIYRRIFSHAGLAGIHTACARRMAARRMQARGASTAEIAHALGVKPQAAQRLLRRAFAKDAPMPRPAGTRAWPADPLARAPSCGNLDMSTNRDHRRHA